MPAASWGSPATATATFNVISDEYRATYINGIQPQNDNFGHETYYGQDFIYKTDAGQIFDVCLAYPIADKKHRAAFGKRKAEIALYAPWLARAFALTLARALLAELARQESAG